MKNLKKLVLVSSLIIAANAAQAAESRKGIYGGIEANRQKLSLAGQESFYKTESFAPSVLLGYRFGNVVDLEVSYMQTSGSKSGLEDASQGISNGSTKVKVQSLAVDALKTFRPFDGVQELGFFGLVGVSANKAEISESGNFFGQPNAAKSSATGLGYGFGGGVSYDLTNNATIRVKVKHSVLNLSTSGLAGTGGVNDATVVSVGALYRF